MVTLVSETEDLEETEQWSSDVPALSGSGPAVMEACLRGPEPFLNQMDEANNATYQMSVRARNQINVPVNLASALTDIH